MPEYQQQFRIVSTKMVAGRPHIHVFSADEPGDGFLPVEPDLEDVFFSCILGLE
jgi:hypothetical protein